MVLNGFPKMFLRAAILVAIMAIQIASPNTVDKRLPQLDRSRFGGTKPCCLGNNVYSRGKCTGNDTNFQLDCPFSMYMMDPTMDKLDMFYINEKYELSHGIDGSSGVVEESNSFCITNLGNSTSHRPIALVCFGEQYDESPILIMIKGIMLLISAAFVLATLYVYYLIPELRTSQDKVTIVLLSCMFMFLVSLGFLQLFPSAGMWCHTNAFMAYFFMMAYFTWMNLVMLNVWKNSVCVRWKIEERTWYILNHIYGWSVPIMLTANLYLQMDAHYGHYTCFVNRGRSTWLFVYLPIVLMLILNVIAFVWSAWAIHMSGQDVSPDRKRALAYKLRLYVQLALFSGLTWFLELISSYFNDTHYTLNIWVFVDAINVMLGVFVFLILVVFRKRIRKELAGKRILCFRAPASWANSITTDEEFLHKTDHEILKEPHILT